MHEIMISIVYIIAATFLPVIVVCSSRIVITRGWISDAKMQISKAIFTLDHLVFRVCDRSRKQLLDWG